MARTVDGNGDGPPRFLLIAAIAVAVAGIVAVLAIAVARQLPEQQRPVPIASVPAPRAEASECRALLEVLPEDLGDYRRATAAEPAPQGAAAWQRPDDTEPIILRCGLERPAEFVIGAPTQVVDPVQWFKLTDADRSTWFAVDRPVYIALTLPSGSGPTPIQEISETIAETMPATRVDPAPVR